MLIRSRHRETSAEVAFNLFNRIFLFLLSLIFLYPFWYVVICSISSPSALRGSVGIILWPKEITWAGYRVCFNNPNIWMGYKNTFLYVLMGTSISIVLTTLGGYALSRPNLMLKKPVMILITITMFFGGGLVPTYMLVRNLGMINTRWAIVLPGALSTYNMIVMRTSFQGIPVGMIESAKIDGANDFRILWSIVLPTSKALLAVIALFYGVGMWNSWFSASIYLQDRELFPLQIILQEIIIKNSPISAATVGGALDNMNQDDYYTRTLLQYSTIIVSSLPIILLYPFLQKYFVKGVMIGSIKG